MPRIKQRYRTTAETAIMGESLAGLFVVETLVVEPGLFDTYIAFDPSLWWNDEKLLADANNLPAQAPGKRRLFLASSSEPKLADAARRLAQLLEKRALPWLESSYLPLPDETHATIYHPAALKALRVLFRSSRGPSR